MGPLSGFTKSSEARLRCFTTLEIPMVLCQLLEPRTGSLPSNGTPLTNGNHTQLKAKLPDTGSHTKAASPSVLSTALATWPLSSSLLRPTISSSTDSSTEISETCDIYECLSS